MADSFVVQPTSVLYVEGKTSIADCLLKMRKAHIRCALILDNEGPTGRVIGIFTEWDLVEKASFLAQPLAYSRPVRAIMTKTVHTLPFEQIDKVASFMIKHRIRSVPLTLKHTTLTRNSIAGVVHAFDIVQNQVTLKEVKRRTKSPRLNIAVVSENTKYAPFLEAALSPTIQVRAQAFRLQDVWKEGILHLPLNRDVFVLDLDHYSLRDAATFLKQLVHNPKAKRVILVYDEALQPKGIKQLATKSKGQKKLLVFQKPINPTELLEKTGLQHGL